MPQLLFLPYWQVATKTYGRPRTIALDPAQVVVAMVAAAVAVVVVAVVVKLLAAVGVKPDVLHHAELVAGKSG